MKLSLKKMIKEKKTDCLSLDNETGKVLTKTEKSFLHVDRIDLCCEIYTPVKEPVIETVSNIDRGISSQKYAVLTDDTTEAQVYRQKESFLEPLKVV